MLQVVLLHVGFDALVGGSLFLSDSRRSGPGVEHQVVDVAADDVSTELRRRHEERTRSYERIEDDVSAFNFRLVGHQQGQLRIHASVANKFSRFERQLLNQLSKAAGYLQQSIAIPLSNLH